MWLIITMSHLTFYFFTFFHFLLYFRLLGCYVIFVIVDTVFHITPKENYIDALSNAVKNATS